MGCAINNWPPTRLHVTDHCPLGPAIRPVFNPPDSPHPAHTSSASLWGLKAHHQCRQYLLFLPHLPSQPLHCRKLSVWSSMTSLVWIHAGDSWWLSCPSHTWKWFPGLAAFPPPSGGLKWVWLLVVPCILIPALPEDRSDNCFPPVLGHLSQSPWLFRDNQEWPRNDIRQLLQHSWMHHTLVYVTFV